MKLNLGCGDRYIDGYVNLDYSPITNNNNKTKCDVFHNMKFGLPFESDSAEEIIFHQVLEHFNRHDSIEILKEIFRVLAPGGSFICSVPPAEKQIKMFLMQMRNVKSIDDFLYAHEKFSPIKYHDDLAGGTVRTIVDGADIGDFMSHKTFYSKEMLSVVLRYIGFNILVIDDKIEAICSK